MDELEQLKARVHNLELALQAMGVLLGPLQPLVTQNSLAQVMNDHFNAGSSMGAFQTTEFEARKRGE